MRTRLCLMLFVGMLAMTTTTLFAQEDSSTDQPPNDPPRKGSFTITVEGFRKSTFFDVIDRSSGSWKSPASRKEKFEEIRQGKGDEIEGIWNKEVGHPTWNVYVPQSYDPDVPAGVIVYIHSGDDPGASGRWGWNPVVDKHNLIYISPANAGNDQDTRWRIIAAMEGVKVIQDRYNVDPDRFYVTGGSGGGRVSSVAGFKHADFFTGAMPQCGANHFRPTEVSDKPNHYRRHFEVDPEILDLAKQRSRFAYITGEKDYNRQEAIDISQDAKSLGFTAECFIMPNKGHGVASAEYFEKGIEFLDAPLFKAAEDHYKKAQELEAAKRLDAALEAYSHAQSHLRNAEWSKNAKQKAKELADMRDADIAAVTGHIENGELREALVALIALRRNWPITAKDDVTRLNDELREARIAKSRATINPTDKPD